MLFTFLDKLRKAIEDVNSGVTVAVRRDSFSSQGETGEFNFQGVSPGAPIDIETGKN